MQVKCTESQANALLAARNLSRSSRKAEKRRIFAQIRKDHPSIASARKFVLFIERPSNPLYLVLRDKRTKLPLDDGRPTPLPAPAVVSDVVAKPKVAKAVAKKAPAKVVAKKAPAKVVAKKAPAKVVAKKAPVKAAVKKVVAKAVKALPKAPAKPAKKVAPTKAAAAKKPAKK